MRLLFSCTAALLLGAGAATAHVGPLDASFGDGGMRNYGFQPIGNAASDRAIVACPGPNNTLTTVGTASDSQRIVTIRLRDNGDYDTSFSDDGKASFDLPGTYSQFTPGLCQPDGNLVVARSFTAPGGEQSLQIFRVLKTDGQLDGGFGTGGVVSVDLDSWVQGLGTEEQPLGVNVLPNGDIAVSGRTTLAAGGERGFVVLLASNGLVRTAAVLPNVRSRTATTSIEAPDGRLWVFGQNGRIGGAYRATLNRTTLAWEAVLEHGAPAGQAIWVGGGRPVDAQTVVLAASAAVSGAYDGTPQLITFRANGASTLTLPAAQLDAQAYSTSVQMGLQGVTVLPRRRVLYAATGGTSQHQEIALHFALAEIGADASTDRVDTTFGVSGAQTAMFRSTAPGCSANASRHAYGRLTLWRDRPVFVGAVNLACVGSNLGDDYLVARIQTETIFADDFN